MTDQRGGASRDMWWLALTGFAAAALMLWITAYGIGINADSTVYLSVAKSVLAGHGFYAHGDPVRQYPPLYPLLLAISSLFAADMLQAARGLQAALFGVNVVLVGVLASQALHRSPLGVLGVMLVFGSSAAILTQHSFVWSEPAFFSFAFTSLLLLAIYVHKRRLGWLIASAAGVSLAIATRYVGVALLLPLCWTLLVASPSDSRAGRRRGFRWRDTLIGMSIAVVPFALWLVRNILSWRSAPTNQRVAIHVLSLAQVKAAVIAMSDLVLPLGVPSWMQGLLFSLIVATGVWVFVSFLLTRTRGGSDTPAETITVLVAMTAVSYLGFLVFSISFLEATTTMDGRLLSPLLVFVAIAFAGASCAVASRLRTPVIWRACVTVLFVSVSVNMIRTVPWAITAHRDGQLYGSRSWRTSEAIAATRLLPASLKIYANEPDAIRFLAERDASWIPLPIVPTTAAPNPVYREQLRLMCAESMDGVAVVVWLTRIQPPLSELREAFESTCPRIASRNLADGRIYGAAR